MVNLLLLLSVVVAPPETPRVKVTYHRQLDAAARMPIAVERGGERMLYFHTEVKEDGDRRLTKYTYWLSNVDGSDAAPLYETPADWDDVLNTVFSPALFAADGRIAVATTDNRRGLRGDDPGKVVPGFIRPGEEVQAVECEHGSTGGFGFAGNDLLFLDTTGINGGNGYKLKRLRDGEIEVLDEAELGTAFCLRIDPTGGRVAYFTAAHVRNSSVTMRMIDLKSGKPVSSPEFRSQDITFDGRPQLFWDAGGDGVFCHVSVDADSKWPYELTHYNFAEKTGYVASPLRNLGMSTVLDERHVAVWHPDVRGCSVLDVTNKRLYQMPAQNYILGGWGRDVVIADLDRDGVYTATIELPQE